jgi:hypothetical protein
MWDGFTDYIPGRRTFSSPTMWMRQCQFWHGWLQSGELDTARLGYTIE